jgi:hypothetical protein
LDPFHHAFDFELVVAVAVVVVEVHPFAFHLEDEIDFAGMIK